MRTKTSKLLAIALLAAALGGCARDNFRDVEGVSSKNPDSIEAYNNLDGHPNIAKVCIDGVAFATTTRDAQAAIQRVEDWDRTCPGGDAEPE